LKKDMQAVADKVKAMSDSELSMYMQTRTMTVMGYELTGDDVQLSYTLIEADKAAHYEAHSDGQVIALLDMSVDDSLQDEGLSREIISRMQKQRKTAKLNVADVCCVYANVTPPECDVARVLRKFVKDIETATKQQVHIFTQAPADARILDTNTTQVKDATLQLVLVDLRSTTTNANVAMSKNVGDTVTLVNFDKKRITLPVVDNGNMIDMQRLMRETRAVFQLHTRVISLFTDEGRTKVVHPLTKVQTLVGTVLYVGDKHVCVVNGVVDKRDMDDMDED